MGVVRKISWGFPWPFLPFDNIININPSIANLISYILSKHAGSTFLRFLLDYPFDLLVISIDVVLVLLLHVFLRVSEDLDAFLPQLFHLFERRARVYVALVVAKILFFIWFSLFVQEIILVDYFWSFFSLLDYLFVAWPSEDIIFVDPKG